MYMPVGPFPSLGKYLRVCRPGGPELSALLHRKETLSLLGIWCIIMPQSCFVSHHAALSGFNVVDLNAHSNLQLMLPSEKKKA